RVGEIEPERRHLREEGALVRDAVGQDEIERRDAVRRDDEQTPVAEVVRIAHLASMRPVRQRSLNQRRRRHALAPQASAYRGWSVRGRTIDYASRRPMRAKLLSTSRVK